jgi:hypothetical protein
MLDEATAICPLGQMLELGAIDQQQMHGRHGPERLVEQRERNEKALMQRLRRDGTS